MVFSPTQDLRIRDRDVIDLARDMTGRRWISSLGELSPLEVRGLTDYMGFLAQPCRIAPLT